MRGEEISWVNLLVVIPAASVTRSSHVLLLFLKIPLSVKTPNPKDLCDSSANMFSGSSSPRVETAGFPW